MRFFLLILLLPTFALAQIHPMLRDSGLPIPRFVSLKSSTINFRAGPGKDYPIRWVYKRKGLPVEVIGEFGHWRKLRAQDGTIGWVHSRLLSGQRSGIVLSSQHYKLIPIYLAASPSSKLIMEAHSGAQLSLLQCKTGWCEISQGNLKGWIERKHLWGIYPSEQFGD